MPCPESDAATYRRVRWGSAIQDDEGVTMDDLTLIFGTEVSGKVTGRPSEQLGQLVRPIVDQAASDGTAGGIADVDRVTTAEMAFDGDDSRGEQGFTTADHGRHRTLIEDEPPLWVGRVGEPEQP